MRRRYKQHPVTKLELVRCSYEPQVQVKEALDRWLTIEAKGGDPIAWWSKHNGYRVVDRTEWALLQSGQRDPLVPSKY